MEKFLSNQIVKQLDMLYDLKPASQTLPRMSTKIFGVLTPHTPTPPKSKQKTPEGSVQLGSPSFFTKIMGKRLFLFDVNSLYPFCFINRFPSKTNISITSRLMTITKAEIIPPNFSRTPHPLISNRNGNTFYTPEEIKYLVRSGYTLKITDQLRLPYKTNIFADFVIHLFSRKKNHPKLVKHLLNSFYGKLISSEVSNTTILAPQCMLSYSRVYTHTIMSNKTNTSFYTDTDSFTVQHPFKTNTSQKLGLCKNTLSQLEFKAADSINITSPRNYTFITGNKKGAKNIGTGHNLKHIGNPTYRIIRINGERVNSISAVEFIYN